MWPSSENYNMTKLAYIPNMLTATKYLPQAVNQTALGTGVSAATGTVYYSPMVFDTNKVFESMVLDVSTGVATATAYIGVYSDNNGRPDQLLYVSALLDVASTGIVTSTQTMSFIKGVRYWTAFLNLVAISTFRCATASNLAYNMGNPSGVSSASTMGYAKSSQTTLTATAPTVEININSSTLRPSIFFML